MLQSSSISQIWVVEVTPQAHGCVWVDTSCTVSQFYGQQFMENRTSIVIHDGCKLNNLHVVNTSLFTTVIELSYLSQHIRKLS
jgi:hypothetical protein